MKGRTIIQFIPIVFIAMVLVVTSPTQAVILQNTMLPVNEHILHPQTGEIIDLDGYLHARIALTNDNNGGIHYHYSTQAAGIHGIGMNGDKYIVKGTDKFSMTVKNGTSPKSVKNIINHQSSFHVTGPGKDNNFVLRIGLRMVRDNSGKLNVYIDYIRTSDGKSAKRAAPPRHNSTTVLWGHIKTQC